MKCLLAFLLVAPLTAGASEPVPSPAKPNQVAGTWRMVSATVEADGKTEQPYSEHPQGMLVFTADMHFVEVLTNPDTPRFKSDTRGGGSTEENKRAMASSIGFFGTYTVDEQGRFTGNRIEGATFPNWVGAVRTQRELQLKVVGDRMHETFTRPDGGQVRAEFLRVR
ncbi:lipocalin-like domain-containing protein [Pseudoxanthomonas sp. CF125]|uniref:lipocalin-like domain-containing protein n=1 Tax=Pseudoxanthomonas sp. CF125 TaxID=1855303 RepID=UPI00088A5566|nr:lipocalin-like domain-containing protein [Pseudoxanthomonas sp. CF125]SDR05412.1 Lipocalin-like domain-containing protein [Pseudoxanthomonas sp. CF125]